MTIDKMSADILLEKFFWDKIFQFPVPVFPRDFPNL
jgi:hypothetical protein